VTKSPETRYAKSADGTSVAYQVSGEGPPDLAITIHSVPLDLMWDEPGFLRARKRLDTFCRSIWFESRGQGGSGGQEMGLAGGETFDTDLDAVLEDIGSERVVVLGSNTGGPQAIQFATTHPGLVSALVLVNTFAHYVREPGYPIGLAPDAAERAEANRAVWRSDVRELLGAIQVPTLVVHRRGDRVIRVEAGRYLAEHIKGARYVELPGEDHLFFVGDTDAILDEIEEFLTGHRSALEGDVVLATVLFTDIVDSTEQAARLGHRAWRELSDNHDALVRAALGRHAGQEVKTMGDGFLATFDGGARAVRCALEIVEEARAIGLGVRAGLHVGDVEARGDDISGLAVAIGKRVCDIADSGDVLVSETMRGLLVGSGIELKDLGGYELKGVPGEWRLFAVQAWS
jgi:class 3 adenylate cyclase